MTSNKSARIILGGLLLVLAAGALRWWLSRPETTAANPDAPAGSVASVEQGLQTTSARPRPGVRLRSASPASSSPRTNQATPAPQQRLYVEWRGTWYAAEILTSSGDSHYIRYSGYGSQWDEWVTAERMRYSEADSAPPQNPATPLDSTPTTTLTYPVTSPEPAVAPEPQLDFAPVVQGNPAKGDLLVEWGTKWWPAEILKQEGSSYWIHYKNYGTNWDEWVTLDRIGHYTGTE